MSMFASPAEHSANSPQTWQVSKAAGVGYYLRTKDGVQLDRFQTKRAAQEAKESSFLTRLYEKESRWYAGEQVEGWQPYAEVAP